MIQLDFSQTSSVLSEYKATVGNLRPQPLYYFNYLHRVLSESFERENPVYPMEIKIPKDNMHLLRGDFEPAQIIRIDKPIMMPLSDKGEVPMWFSQSAKQAWLRFGYKNLDARHISDNKLDMEYIHGFLGGSSGHGKSVTLNAVIASLCFEYAPWELELHLSDAKIIEFKKYGVNHRIPHIRSIAATEDADYVISVLERAFDEMNQRGKYFANIGASNLKSFREKTGLAIPRVLIIMDEVESTFKLAGRQANRIADLIDGFSRLGRAAGYHIIMATQNMSSDIPKSAVGQIRVRMCLGANQATSEAVLGNNGATENIGRIGRLIVNTEAMGGGKTQPFNVKYQTPFLSDDDFGVEMEFLEQKGKEVGYKQDLSFYDEEDLKTVEQFDKIIDSAKRRMKVAGELNHCDKICLGYPSFVTTDTDQLLKLEINGKDIENILISSAVEEKVAAHIHNISKSLEGSYTCMHFSTNPEMIAYTPDAVGAGELRESDSSFVNGVYSLIRKRIYLLFLESIADGVEYDAEKIEGILKNDGVPASAFGNSLLYRRIAAFKITQQSAEYKNMWNSVDGIFRSSLDLYEEYNKYNTLIRQLTKNDFPKACVFLGDISKVIGWGRSYKSSQVNELRKALQDACRVGMVFVLYSRSFDGLSDLVSGLRYTIFDTPDKKDWGRLKTEEPKSQSSTLAVLYDSLNNVRPQCKFKCTLLRPQF